MHLPNKLTLLRFILIFPFLGFTIYDNVYTRFSALIIFGVASLTDYFDGYIARKRGLVTIFGTFLDPLADKLLISAAFISFVQIPEIHVPSWMVVLIIGREFLITGLRTLAISAGRVIPAQRAGKFKTTSQIVSIILILIILCFNSLVHSMGGGGGGGGGLGYFLKWGPYWLTFATTIFTIISGYIYLNDNADLFQEKKPARKREK